MKKTVVYGTGIAALAPAAALMMSATATAATSAASADGNWIASVGIHQRFADPVKVCDTGREGAVFSGGLCITRG